VSGESPTHEHDGIRRHYRGARLCNAHNGAGELCGAIAVTGKTKCRKHGGRSVSGVAHHSYKHGRYSKDLSVQMAQRAEEARSNPHLLSVSDDMAVLEARLADQMAVVGAGESAQVWKALRKALTLFSVAEREGDGAGMHAAFSEMRRLITVGDSVATAWGEIRKLWETRCKLVQTEVKTLQSLQQMVTVQQMELHLGVVTQVVIDGCERYADPAQKRHLLSYILGEFAKLATLAPGAALKPLPARGPGPAPTSADGTVLEVEP
jgi:hypothetical protein